MMQQKTSELIVSTGQSLKFMFTKKRFLAIRQCIIMYKYNEMITSSFRFGVLVYPMT